MVFFNVFILGKKLYSHIGIGVRYCPLVDLLLLQMQFVVLPVQPITYPDMYLTTRTGNRRRRTGATMTPNQLTSYLKRDTGTTATGNYPHWSGVLETDKAARLWNRMTYAFSQDCPTEKRFDWYAAHFSRVIDEQFAGHDRALLGKKLLAHITQGQPS